MNKYFTNLDDLINYQKECAFCKNKLIPTLTNHLGLNKGLPILNAKYKDGLFKFPIKYSAHNFNLNSDVTVNCTNNLIIFDNLEGEPYIGTTLERAALDVFMRLMPHIELYCSSKKCGLKYYLSSDIFNLFSNETGGNTFEVSHVRLYMECLTYSGFWIQNDLVNTQSNIYVIDNPSITPITTELLDFQSLGKEKLLKRINTLVTFS